MRLLLTSKTALTLLLAAGLAAFAAQGLPLNPDLSFQVLPYTDAVHPGSELRLGVRVRLAETWHVNAHEPLEDYLIPTVLDFDLPEGFSVRRVIYPEPRVKQFAFSEEPMAVYEDDFVIGAIIAVDEAVEPGEYTALARLRYQACNDTECRMPQADEESHTLRVAPAGTELTQQHGEVLDAVAWDAAVDTPREEEPITERPAPDDVVEEDWRELVRDFRVAARETGYMPVDDFLAFLDAYEAGEATGGAAMFAGRSLALVVLLTLAGGFLLNLTPCVLPLIPVNLAIIGAGSRASSRARGFMLGGMYGLGITLTYGVLGLVVVLTGGTFGALNASPWFNLAITILFVVLGLALFDVFLIDLSRFQSKISVGEKAKGHVGLALFMGGIAALLAGACVAPVVIAVIVFSQDLYAQGAQAGLLLPFLLGLGMGLPWAFAGAGLSFLPKPGKWMVTLKHAFGVFILLLAAWYGYQTFTLLQNRYGFGVDPEEVRASADMSDEGWTDSLAHGLARGLEEDKPVFIDFWATWCKSCLTMNRTTFVDPAVRQRMEDYVKVKYQAEDPSHPETRAVLDHFDVLGLPTYVIVEPNGD